MRSTSSSRLIASPLILQPITSPKHKPSKPIFLTTTTPKTLTLICRIENRPTTNKTTMDNPKSNKPTRTRNPRKSSYGTSRRSIIKKSFSQEQVMFTGPLSDDPIIAIIGGGMSGLVCALNLEKRGIRSTVFDTGLHGLGGRMGTRIIDPQPLIFDHAAQFFTVSDPQFAKLVDGWSEKGQVQQWEGTIGELEMGGRFVPLPSSPPRYIGVNGMCPLADSILSQTRMIDVVRPCWISKLEVKLQIGFSPFKLSSHLQTLIFHLYHRGGILKPLTACLLCVLLPLPTKKRKMDYFYGPGRNHLFVPGPVNIPEQVIRAMNRNNEDYRSPAIPAMTRTLLEDVKKIFKTTSGTPFLIPTTGTGAWESALTNTLSPGDRIVSFLIGQFSLLWIDQQQRLNFNVDVVESDWGQGANLEVLASKLAADSAHTIKAICIVHNETATGVTNNLAAVRKILDHYQHPALLLVDGVSSICALDFRMDEWGIDVALTGSQKALSLPTGMGIVCASPKALEASKTAKSVRVFFDWKDYLKFYKMGTFWPYTPSIQLLYGLRTALDLIFEEGLDNVIARHGRLAKATRIAVEAWGLKNCTQKEEWFSDTVTAVLVPPYIDSSQIVKRGWQRYNLSLGLGLNKVAGKVFRIGHLGNLNELQLLGCLAGVEMVLKDVGYPVKLGSGVGAACAFLQNTTPLIASRI